MDARPRHRIKAILLCAIAVAGLSAVAQATSASADTPPISVSREAFFADSGDACLYGVTRGELGWHLPPLGGAAVAVDVTGAVVDRPASTAPVHCEDDRRYSVATVTAFAGRAAVDRESVAVDNGTRQFGFRLVGAHPEVIDRVVVQVCRPARAPDVPVYCGREQVYRSPVA